MRTARRILFSLAAAAGIALGASLAAAANEGCGAEVSWTEFRAVILNLFPEAKEHTVSGEAKKAIVDRYNATPPFSTLAPDRVRYLTHPENPVALVILQRERCVVGWAYISVALLNEIIDARPAGAEV